MSHAAISTLSGMASIAAGTRAAEARHERLIKAIRRINEPVEILAETPEPRFLNDRTYYRRLAALLEIPTDTCSCQRAGLLPDIENGATS